MLEEHGSMGLTAYARDLNGSPAGVVIEHVNAVHQATNLADPRNEIYHWVGANEPRSNDTVGHMGAPDRVSLGKRAAYKATLLSAAAEERFLERRHSELTRKRFFTESGLESRETRELDLIEWKLNQIEKARLEPVFAKSDRLVALQHDLAKELELFAKSLPQT